MLYVKSSHKERWQKINRGWTFISTWTSWFKLKILRHNSSKKPQEHWLRMKCTMYSVELYRIWCQHVHQVPINTVGRAGEQRPCPRCSGPGFESQPGVLCCMSPPSISSCFLSLKLSCQLSHTKVPKNHIMSINNDWENWNLVI